MSDCSEPTAVKQQQISCSVIPEHVVKTPIGLAHLCLYMRIFILKGSSCSLSIFLYSIFVFLKVYGRNLEFLIFGNQERLKR